MKKLIVMALITGGLVIGVSAQGFASDWDKAGKAFAIIEGLRVVTGGKVDVIGSVTGINRPRQEARGYGYSRGPDRGRYANRYNEHVRYERVWVPHYVYKKRYIPRHTEYRPGCGQVVIEGHYERYRVQEGGHWETRGNYGPRGHR